MQMVGSLLSLLMVTSDGSALLDVLMMSDAIVVARVTASSPGHVAHNYGVEVVESLRGDVAGLSSVDRLPADTLGGLRPHLRVGDMTLLALTHDAKTWCVWGPDAEGEMLIQGETVYATIPLTGHNQSIVALDGRAYDYSARLADLRNTIRDFHAAFDTGRCASKMYRLVPRGAAGELRNFGGRSEVHEYVLLSARDRIEDRLRSWKLSYDQTLLKRKGNDKSQAFEYAWRSLDRAELLGQRHPARMKSLELLVVLYAEDASRANDGARARALSQQIESSASVTGHAQP